MIAERTISPVQKLPSYADLSEEDPELLGKTVMLKLNGGLGTGMGLEKAKSLLKIRGSDTFLDFIAKQARAPPQRRAPAHAPARSRAPRPHPLA